MGKIKNNKSRQPEVHFNSLVLKVLEFLMVDKNALPIEVFDENDTNLEVASRSNCKLDCNAV